MSVAHRRAVTTVAVVTTTAPALYLVVSAPTLTATGLPLAAALIVAALLVGAATVVADNQRAMAIALGAAAGTWLLNLPRLTGPGPVPWIVWAVAPSFWWLLAWVLLRYPAHVNAPRFDRALVVGAAVWVTLVHAGTGLLVRPGQSNDLPTGIWWPTLTDDQGLTLLTSRTYYVIGGLLALFYLGAAIRRWRRLRAIDRWLAAPPAISVLAVVFPAFTWLATPWLATEEVSLLIGLSQTVMLPGLPLSILLVALRQRLVRSTIVETVARLSSPASLASVQEALRSALRDPGLLVLLDLSDGWVGTGGTVITPGSAPPNRVPHAIRSSDGHGVAVLLVEPSLAAHPELMAAAADAASHALVNARLHEQMRHELYDLGASRRRLHEASMEQRQRLERDLHDGVQQRLLALTLGLGATVTRHGIDLPDGVGEDLDRLRGQLHSVLGEVRDLAHGIHPAVLTQSGLEGAIGDLLDRLPLEVACEVSPDRWTATVETTAYYIVCESLNNVIKHAHATRAHVSVVEHEGSLLVQISDDGVGGAQPDGAGVRGMSDRVEALGGSLELSESGGTTVKVRIPCA